MKNNINYYWYNEFKTAYSKLEGALYEVNSSAYDKEVMSKGEAEELKVKMLDLKIEIDLCRRKGKLIKRYEEFTSRIYRIIGIKG